MRRAIPNSARRSGKKRSSARRSARKPPDPRLSPEQRRRARWRLRDPKRLVRAVFDCIDPVEVGKTLLADSGDATKAKSYFQFLDYLFEPPGRQPAPGAAEGEQTLFQFQTHAPRPQYAVDPNSEDQRNKEMCRNSLSGTAVAVPAVAAPTDQEDEND